MHELAVCQALIEQVEATARAHGATAVEQIQLRIGPLSGVEVPLLKHAFPIASAGTVAAAAALEIESMPVEVRCRRCGARGEVPSNRLLCPSCGHWETELISGDEMLLVSVALVTPE